MPFVFVVSAALAWSPGAHRAFADRALALEGLAGGAETAPYARAAAAEDLVITRKWGNWHHYWLSSPMAWRRPSPERVTGLEADLLAAIRAGDAPEAWRFAGLAVHHVQDMASPPHVVPVEHGLGDGFEHADVSALIAAAGIAADGLVGPPSPLGPVDAQRALVAETRDALAVPLLCDDGPLPWTDFWVPPAEGRTFGRLGPRRYGAEPGCAVGTAAFTAARVEAAVAYSRAVARFVVAGLGGALTANDSAPAGP